MIGVLACCSQAVVGQGAVPLLLSAAPGGVQLAAAALELPGSRDAGEAWAGLALLPHACAMPSQALAACDAVLSAGFGSAAPTAEYNHEDVSGSADEGRLFVYCQVRTWAFLQVQIFVCDAMTAAPFVHAILMQHHQRQCRRGCAIEFSMACAGAAAQGADAAGACARPAAAVGRQRPGAAQEPSGQPQRACRSCRGPQQRGSSSPRG